MRTADILIVDDEAAIRSGVEGILQDEGYVVRQAANAGEAFVAVKSAVPSLILLDIWLQDSSHDGLQILDAIKKDHPALPVIMMSGHGTIETAVTALKQGAYDFIEKPFKSDRLLLLIERALETAQLKRENQALRQRSDMPSDLTGSSSAVAALAQMLERVAKTNSRVLITGEAGTGKNVAARMLHRLSSRAAAPFMTLNCAVLRPERLEIELFGEGDKVGILEQANGGTLLLDEVADMSLETQGKIVRLLQEQSFQRVGGNARIDVDVRVIASASRDLQKLMEAGQFRQDFYYRLSVVPITVPPLRERQKDIPDLVKYFAESFATQAGLPPCILSPAAIAALQVCKWQGNVRQLRNVVEWLMIMGAGNNGVVEPEHLPPEIGAVRPVAASDAVQVDALMALPLREAREQFEKDYLESQVRRFDGNISKTAQFVGMERSALHRKLKQLGVGDSAGHEHDEADESSEAA
jgi:two-component system nitrogen regulation response regulator NtrX